ncbi:protein kinase [Ruania suaedae]|uniref:serine/threonine-protein kinase n=1 Tax=Ruania suaedae TaxID=2897774 RepID=UPI001E450B60|nr:serine/threonine-protein kinase [Ruania suaedae]UFU03104.1 protein kinase [Ruania suaedae]
MTPTAGLLLGGRYELTERLATGGMGEIWVATDLHLRRHVAAKVLRAEFAGDTLFLERLRAEARNSAALSHQNIAAMYDYGEQRGSGYLIMELVLGESLEDLLRRERTLEPAQVLPILAQTARALHTAHMAGVVHRDVKPSNILLTRDGYVKITDFGISLGANQAPMTAAGMVMGTAQYLPPEQAMGRAATGAGDIYALGVVAYEALAGRRPFTGTSQVDIAFAHVNQQVPALPEDVDERVQEIVRHMLAKDPEQRPRSAASLARTLEALTEALRVPIEVDEPPATAVAAPAPPPTRAPAPVPEPARGASSAAPTVPESPAGGHRRTLAEAARRNPMVAARASRPAGDHRAGDGDADRAEDDRDAPVPAPEDALAPRWRPVEGHAHRYRVPLPEPPPETRQAPTQTRRPRPTSGSDPSPGPLTRRDLRPGARGGDRSADRTGPRHGPIGLLERLGRTGRWIVLAVAAVALTTLLVALFSRLGAAASPSVAVLTLLVRPGRWSEPLPETVKER